MYLLNTSYGTSGETEEQTDDGWIDGWMDGWMFELFIDAQPQKGIQRLNDNKNTILDNKLGWKKAKEIQD